MSDAVYFVIDNDVTDSDLALLKRDTALAALLDAHKAKFSNDSLVSIKMCHDSATETSKLATRVSRITTEERQRVLEVKRGFSMLEVRHASDFIKELQKRFKDCADAVEVSTNFFNAKILIRILL